jgi:hypothetical protein
MEMELGKEEAGRLSGRRFQFLKYGSVSHVN